MPNSLVWADIPVVDMDRATIYLSAMVGFICFFLDSEGNRIGIQQPAANKR